MHWDAGAAVGATFHRRFDGLLGVRGRDVCDHVAGCIEQATVAVVFEDGAEDPAVTVEVGELGKVQLRIEFRDPGQEIGSRGLADVALRVGVEIGPQAAHRAAFGILRQTLPLLLRRRMLRGARIQVLAVGFVVPPHVAEVAVGVRRARVHVANDALARRHAAREGVTNRVAALTVGNRRVDGLGCPEIAGVGERARMKRIAIVGVRHVASRAAALAVVAGMVVGAEERQQRIEQPGAL